jgi:RimJ/RimL family protein N-acetyltransferase
MEVTFRKIQKEDMRRFKDWGKHDDPRFFQYNFGYDSQMEYDAWYYSKQRWIFRKVYGLFLDDHPVGFITLKHINYFKKTAELGIAVDPNHLSKGYGTKMLRMYLDHVFERFPIEEMHLKVSYFNTRAQKSYSKVGFRQVAESYEPFEEQGYKDLIMDRFPQQFDLIEGTLYTRFIKMKIDKNTYLTARDQ